MESVSLIGGGDPRLPNHAALFVHYPGEQQSGPEAAAWGSLTLMGSTPLPNKEQLITLPLSLSSLGASLP